MGTVTMVNEPITETEGDTPAEVPTPDTETAVDPTVPAEEPAPEEPAEPEATPEVAPEEPAADPESTLDVATTPDVFGYVTITGKATDVVPPLALRIIGDANTRWFANTFPVTPIHGEFAMTVHLPPGGHTVELFDRERKHASATFNVV